MKLNDEILKKVMLKIEELLVVEVNDKVPLGYLMHHVTTQTIVHALSDENSAGVCYALHYAGKNGLLETNLLNRDPSVVNIYDISARGHEYLARIRAL